MSECPEGRIKVKEDTFPLVNPSCKLNNAFLGSGIYGKLFRVFNKKKKISKYKIQIHSSSIKIAFQLNYKFFFFFNCGADL